MNLAILAALVAQGPAVELGVDPNMGAAALGAVILSKMVFYPLVGLRRRKITDDGDGTGPFFVPPRIQGALVLMAAGAAAVLGAVLTHSPVMPTISAAMTGLALARAGHEVVQPPASKP